MSDFSAAELDALRRIQRAFALSPNTFIVAGGWAARLLRRHPLARPPDHQPIVTEDLDVAVPREVAGLGSMT